MSASNLPPAPDGFAWMSCYESKWGARAEGVDHAVALFLGIDDGVWEHTGNVENFHVEAAARLVRRLGPNEDPAEVDGATMHRGATWRIYGDTAKALACGQKGDWYAPVRFAGAVPNFGETGARYLDEDEKCSYWVWEDAEIDGEIRRVRVTAVTLPPLPKRGDEPTEDSSLTAPRLSWCGEVGRKHDFDCGVCLKCGAMTLKHRNPVGDEPRLACAAHRAEESERLALIELDYLRSELAKATREQVETQAGWRRATEKALLGAKENERLIAELAKVTVERDALRRDLDHIEEESNAWPPPGGFQDYRNVIARAARLVLGCARNERG